MRITNQNKIFPSGNNNGKSYLCRDNEVTNEGSKNEDIYITISLKSAYAALIDSPF
jgi:hypothetical protein